MYNNIFQTFRGKENSFSLGVQEIGIKLSKLRLFDTIWETGIMYYYNEPSYEDWFETSGGGKMKNTGNAEESSRERGEE